MTLKQRTGVLLGLLLLGTACTNNQLIQGLTDQIENSAEDFLNTLLTLQAVVISNSASGEVELIGDAVGSFCITATDDTGGDATTSFGPSSCQCEFDYTGEGGANVIERIDTTYVESGMIRCPIPVLAESAPSVKVRLYAQNIDAGSNQVTVNFSGTSNSLDPADSGSYVEVQRRQCRDHIYIPHMFCENPEGCLYDPIQSESTRLSYPLDFYSSNIGGMVLSIAQAATFTGGLGVEFYSKWECSFDRENPKWWENMFLYSVGPDTAGSVSIFPNTASAFDRHTFHLAKRRTSVFNIPVNGYQAPGVLTRSPDSTGQQTPGTFAPIGYGARPIPTPTGEVCPETSVTIPAGYRWVKVWAFKGDFVPRRYVSITEQVIQNGQVACNPGDFVGGTIVFDDCASVTGTADGTADDETWSLQLLESTRSLSARVFLGTGSCFQFPGAFDRTAGAPAQYGAPWIDNYRTGQATEVSSEYQAGSDLWEKTSNNTVLPTPWNLDGQDADDDDNNAAADTADGEWDGGDQGVPFDTALNADLDLDNSQSRPDYVFVVSPTTLTFEVMNNKDPGYEPYYPYRFRNKEDCPYLDPDANGCNEGKKVYYDLYSAEISDDPNAPSVENRFPVCALQPI